MTSSTSPRSSSPTGAPGSPPAPARSWETGSNGHSIRPFLKTPGSHESDGPAGALSMIFVGQKNRQDFTGEQVWDANNQHWTLRTETFRSIPIQ